MSTKGKKVEPCIYRQPDGQFLAIANIPIIGHNGKKRYRRPEKTFTSRAKARKWLKTEKAKSQLGMHDSHSQEPRTLGELLTLSQVEKQKLRSWNTIQNQRKVIVGYFGEDRAIRTITRHDVARFREWLLAQPKKNRQKGAVQPATVNRYLAELRWLFNYAVEEEWIPKAPKVEMLHAPGIVEFHLTLADFLSVVKCLPTAPYPHQAMTLMALNTGQRFGDLIKMEWRQILEEEIMFRSSKTMRENLRVPLMNATKEALVKLRKTRTTTSPYIFLNPQTLKPITTIKRSFLSAIKRAGVKRFRFHDIRHLATTELLRLTKDRDLVQRLIGWSDQTMVKRYGHVSDRAIPAFQKWDERIQSHLDETFARPSQIPQNLKACN